MGEIAKLHSNRIRLKWCPAINSRKIPLVEAKKKTAVSCSLVSGPRDAKLQENSVLTIISGIKFCSVLWCLTLKKFVFLQCNHLFSYDPIWLIFLYKAGLIEYVMSAVDVDGMLLLHQGTSSYIAVYASMRFQLFMG